MIATGVAPSIAFLIFFFRRTSKTSSPAELKKDLGIPNLEPFKKRMMHQMEQQKETAERKAKLAKLKQKEWEKRVTAKSIEELAAEAAAAAREQAMRLDSMPPRDEDEKDAKPLERSRKNYVKELQKVIEESDVILQVLDARDPMGCRNKELESHIIGKNKRIILVLNKIDLVPPYAFFGCSSIKVWTQKST